MYSRQQMRDTIVERLFWHSATRDEAQVAEHLYRF